MQFVEVNGILVPYVATEKRSQPAGPTQAEIDAVYYPRHKRCPQCGGNLIESTCLGYIFRSIESAKDSNRAVCDCGWVGVVHDLVPEPEPSAPTTG